MGDPEVDPPPRGIEEEALDAQPRKPRHERVLIEQQVFERLAGSDEVQALCERISSQILDWIEIVTEFDRAERPDGSQRTHAEELEAAKAHLASTSPTEKPYAGRVQRGHGDKMWAALAEPNIRVCFYHLDVFLRHRFFGDIVNVTDAAYASLRRYLDWTDECKEWLDEKRAPRRNGVPANARRAEDAHALYKDFLIERGTPFQALRDRDGNAGPDLKRPPTPCDRLHRRHLHGLCNHEGVECTPHALAAKRDTAKLEGEEHPYAWSLVPREPLYVPLSEFEAELRNQIDPDCVPYIRGDFANVLRAEHDWVTASHERELPLRAGPSGTAYRLLIALTGMGHDPLAARLAIAGFLVPIHAHSCHEILFATGGISTCKYAMEDYSGTPSVESLMRLFGGQP